MSFEKELSTFSYRELQNLAKYIGAKANKKAFELVIIIDAWLIDNKIELQELLHKCPPIKPQVNKLTKVHRVSKLDSCDLTEDLTITEDDVISIAFANEESDTEVFYTPKSSKHEIRIPHLLPSELMAKERENCAEKHMEHTIQQKGDPSAVCDKITKWRVYKQQSFQQATNKNIEIARNNSEIEVECLKKKMAEMETLCREKEWKHQEIMRKFQAQLEEEKKLVEQKMKIQLEQRNKEYMCSLEDERKKLICERAMLEKALDEESKKKLAEQNSQLQNTLRSETARLEALIAERNEEKKQMEAIIMKEKQEKLAFSGYTTNMEAELQCSICNELLVKATTVNCSHSFCEFCIADWMLRKKTCPMCRAVIVTCHPSLMLDKCVEKLLEYADASERQAYKLLVDERKGKLERLNANKTKPLATNAVDAPYEPGPRHDELRDNPAPFDIRDDHGDRQPTVVAAPPAGNPYDYQPAAQPNGAGFNLLNHLNSLLDLNGVRSPVDGNWIQFLEARRLELAGTNVARMPDNAIHNGHVIVGLQAANNAPALWRAPTTVGTATAATRNAADGRARNWTTATTGAQVNATQPRYMVAGGAQPAAPGALEVQGYGYKGGNHVKHQHAVRPAPVDYVQPFNGLCFRCSQWGHRSYQCPLLK